MADEQVKKGQETAESTDDQKAEKKGGMLKFILIPLILLIQAGIAYYVVFNVLLKNPNQLEEPKEPKENLEVGQFFEINDLVVNPADSKGRRYLVLEVALETNDEKLLEEVKSKEIWVRDAIITLLTKKTAEELIELTVRVKLKKEILETLNARMACGKFERLYFKKYLLQ